MKILNIPVLALVASVFFTANVTAQSINFKGWSAALGSSVVDGNLKIADLNQGQSANLGRTKIVGTLDASYSFPVNDKWVVGAGATYDLSSARVLDVVLLNGKVENHTSVYVQPTFLLTPSTGVFAKLGYHKAVLVGEGGLISQNSGFSESIHGTGIGFGVKSYISNDVFVQFEMLSTKFKTKSVVLGDASTPSKASLTSMNVSIGYQFN